MEFFIADENGRDLCVLTDDAEIDVEIGKNSKNDFQLTIPYSMYDAEIYKQGNVLYTHGREYGGVLGDMKVSTEYKTIKFVGDTWRGLLAYDIVEPPAGQAYRTVSGELNAVIRELVGTRFNAMFEVSSEDTHKVVTDFKLDRYATVLDSIIKVLDSVKYRLKITPNGYGETLRIVLSAEPIQDYSASIEVSQDSNVDFEISKNYRRYEYMIAAGSGELEKRAIVKLHLKEDGTVEEVDTIPDKVRTIFYDYPNIEDNAKLAEEGEKRFASVNSTDTQSVTVSDEAADYDMGDIVGGRDYMTGIFVAEPITAKVVKIKDGAMSINYTVGEEIWRI